jgi:hypothetical protein
LNILCSIPFGSVINTPTIADKIGLNNYVIGNILQNLSAVGVLVRDGDDNSHTWRFRNEIDWKIIRRINGVVDEEIIENRKAIAGEGENLKDMADKLFDELSTT